MRQTNRAMLWLTSITNSHNTIWDFICKLFANSAGGQSVSVRLLTLKESDKSWCKQIVNIYKYINNKNSLSSTSHSPALFPGPSLGNTNMETILSSTCSVVSQVNSPISPGKYRADPNGGMGKTFFTFNYKEGLKLAHKSHSLHRIIAEVTLTMKIATYLTGLVFLRTWIRTFLTTVWTLESRQMFFFLRKYLNIVISTKMILFSWTCKFLIVALGLVGIFEFSQEFLWLKVTKIHYQWLTVQKKIFLSVLIPTCDWHICLISLQFQTKTSQFIFAEIRSGRNICKVII